MSAQYNRRPEQIDVHVLGHKGAYVNEGYAASVNDLSRAARAPPTGVVREQYWACSRWPRAQRLMAVALGVLLGAVVGLAISMGLRAAAQQPILGPVFRGTVEQ